MIWYLIDNIKTVYSYDDNKNCWIQLKSILPIEKIFDKFCWYDDDDVDTYIPQFLYNRKLNILLPEDLFLELL